MNSSLNTGNAQNQKPGLKSRLPMAVFGITIAAVVIASLFLLSGYKRPTKETVNSDPRSKGDAWEEFGKKLKKETDFVACQSAMLALGEKFRNDDSIPKPAMLGPDEESALASTVPLSKEDKDEIRDWHYSAHDPVYLADCLYLRDVAQSLKLPNLSPEQLADVGFAWVCRSIALQPWLVPGQIGSQRALIAVALPPTWVLRRGYGSALERMYVFLALLQQLDLEGCLIGPPDPKDVMAWDALDAQRVPYPGGPPRPFWAVGVRVGSDIKIYDPWRGEAFPAGLSAIKSNPNAHRSWLEDAANLSRLKPDDLTKATVYLVAPVNALSSRMETLNKHLAKEGVSIRLAINPKTWLSTFPDPKPTFWNPPEDRFAYGRVARTFLPREQGGADDAQPRIFDGYVREQIPVGLNRINSPELEGEYLQVVNERLFHTTVAFYLKSFVEAPNPRERIQRGFYQDAIRDLIQKQDIFAKGYELFRNTPDAEERIHDWCRVTKELYEKLGRTGLIADKSERASTLSLAQSEIENHWRESTVELIASRISIPILKIEVSFLIALCKQEEAERTQTQMDYAKGEEVASIKEKARDAWINARSAWRTYYEGYNIVQDNIPGRSAQAKFLSARAEKFAGMKP